MLACLSAPAAGDALAATIGAVIKDVPGPRPPVVLPGVAAAAPEGAGGAISAADPLRRFLPAERSGKGYEIIINLPSMALVLYHDGRVAAIFPIAIGSNVSPSRLGTTHIKNKVADPTYYPPDWAKKGLKPIPPGPDNPVGTRWLGLEWEGYGIHGTNNPASIGSAVSGGCIRMYNADVERLTGLVPIGTPVTFVYETLLIWHDAGANWPYIQAYPDVYHIKPPTLSAALAALAETGFTAPVHREVLQALLNLADGIPELVPATAEVIINNNKVLAGYYDGRDVYAPVRAVADEVGWAAGLRVDTAVWVEGEKLNTARIWAGRAYAQAMELALVFGLSIQNDGRNLDYGILKANGMTLPGRLWNAPAGHLVPLAPVATWRGWNLEWDKAAGLARLADRQLPALIKAGRLYAAESDILTIFPEFTMLYREPEAICELLAPPASDTAVMTALAD